MVGPPVTGRVAAATRTAVERPYVYGIQDEDGRRQWLEEFTEMALRALGVSCEG